MRRCAVSSILIYTRRWRTSGSRSRCCGSAFTPARRASGIWRHTVELGPRTILIDGYNAIRRTPSLAAAERISLEEGRAALLVQVVARYRATPHTVIVVFDGSGETEHSEPLARRTRGR